MIPCIAILTSNQGYINSLFVNLTNYLLIIVSSYPLAIKTQGSVLCGPRKQGMLTQYEYINTKSKVQFYNKAHAKYVCMCFYSKVQCKLTLLVQKLLTFLFKTIPDMNRKVNKI